MIDKRVETIEAALAGLDDGARVMISGFGGAGVPVALIKGIEAGNARDLTLIMNSLRHAEAHGPRLFEEGRITRAICTAARSRGPAVSSYERLWAEGGLSLEIVPQGTFSERIRAGGAGIPAFYTPTAVGTALAEGKELREFDGKPCLMELALRADFAVMRGDRADRWGNISFRGTQMNFASAMATAAATTVVEVASIEAEPLDPRIIDIPGIYVQRVLELGPGPGT